MTTTVSIVKTSLLGVDKIIERSDVTRNNQTYYDNSQDRSSHFGMAVSLRMSKWLVRWILDRAVRVQALINSLCCLLG